jgi:hypothetical protein
MVVCVPPEHDTLQLRPDGHTTLSLTQWPVESQLFPVPHVVPPGMQFASQVPPPEQYRPVPHIASVVHAVPQVVPPTSLHGSGFDELRDDPQPTANEHTNNAKA